MKHRPLSQRKERAILLAALGRRDWSGYSTSVGTVLGIVLSLVFFLWLAAAIAISTALHFTENLFALSCLLGGFFYGLVTYHRLAIANWQVVARHLNQESVIERLNELGA
jgi:hypothetical protein